MMKRRMSRRFFLRASAAGAVGIAGSSLLAACGGDDDDPTATTAPTEAAQPGEPTATTAPQQPADPTATTAAQPDPTATSEPAMGSSLIGELEGPTMVLDESQWPTTFNEAPQLAELVAAGQLPPVEERIGQDPIVVQPLHEIGKYGGVWRRGFTGPGDAFNGWRVAGLDWLIGWHWNGQENIPSVAKRWEFSGDGRVMTLYLRRGMRWSDGEPLTADDLVFWYEDMFLNDELVPNKPNHMFVGGEYGELVKIDDFTVEFRFAAPYYMMAVRLARGPLSGPSMNAHQGHGGFAPAHYLRQFHPSYASEEDLNAAMEEAGVDSWTALWAQKANWALNPELPAVTPWIVTSPINTPTFALERNPYCAWVDTEGNQLPYIDEVVMTLAENLEVLNLRAIAGDYDFQARHIDMSKLPVFLENRDQGNYDIYLDTGDYGSDMCIIFNRGYDGDAEIAQWINTADFRRALSLGIERHQINETFWLGTGTPGSPAPAETNKFSPGPEYRTLWHEFDPDRANQMLDELGLTEKDGDGFRQRLDGGGRLRLEVLAVGAQFIPYTQVLEMIAQQWREIGIEMIIREVERSLSETIIGANEHQLYTWNNDGSENVILDPDGIFPYRDGDSQGPLYGRWYVTNGEEGEEPPEDFRAAMELHRESITADDARQIEIGKELWRGTLEQVNLIGIVGIGAAAQGVRIVNRNMGNVPARQYNSPIVKNPVPSCPPTFYYKD